MIKRFSTNVAAIDHENEPVEQKVIELALAALAGIRKVTKCAIL